MSRSKVTIHNLAKESNIDPIDAFFKLSDAGIKIRNEHDSVPKNKLAYARRILNLESKPKNSLTYLSNLLEKIGISEAEFWSKLSAENIPFKKNLIKIPKRVLIKIKLAFGLHKKPEHKDISKPIQINQITPTKEEKLKKTKCVLKRKVFTWSTIGPEQEMVYLNSSEDNS